MTIKAILLDIDGTLTNSKKVITDETRNALLKAQDHGITLVLASGRPSNGLKQYSKLLNMECHNGLLVCSNGAQVINCQTNEILFQKCLTKEQAKKILTHLKSFDVVPLLDHGEYMYTEDVYNNIIEYNGSPFNIMKYESRGNGFLLCEVKDLAQWLDFDPCKILTFGQPEYLQKVYKELSKPFQDVNSMFTAPYYYEFTAKGIDKTKAIQESLLKSGLKQEEIMAFGDAQNDMSMIRFAHIGIAMGNATEELKAVADDITVSNDEDGIAKALYKYLPELYK